MRPTKAESRTTLQPARIAARRVNSFWRSLSQIISRFLQGEEGLLPADEAPGDQRENADRDRILGGDRGGIQQGEGEQGHQEPAFRESEAGNQSESQPDDQERFSG